MRCNYVISMSIALLACALGIRAAGGTGQRPLSFAINAGTSSGKTPSPEMVVNFGPALPISAVALSPDDKLLAAGGYREVLLWDLEKGELAKRVGIARLTGMIHAVVFLGDGKTLAVGDGLPYEPGSVKLFDTATGELVTTFDEPKGMVSSLAVSFDGRLLAAGDENSGVHIWDMDTRKLVKTLTLHTGRVLGVAFSADGKRLATGGADKTIQVWETSTWQPAIRYDVPAAVQGVAMSPDARLTVGAVGGTEEWTLRIGHVEIDLQQVARRKPNAVAAGTGTGMPLNIVWPAKATNVFVACSDHTLRACDGITGRLLMTYNGHADWVYGVASNASGSKFVSGSADGTVKLWNAAATKPMATFVQLAPGADQWLIVTSQGYFNTSSAEQIAWKSTGASTAGELTARYHKPELVRKLLAAATSPVPSFPRRDNATRSADSPGKKKVDVPAKKNKKDN